MREGREKEKRCPESSKVCFSACKTQPSHTERLLLSRTEDRLCAYPDKVNWDTSCWPCVHNHCADMTTGSLTCLREEQDTLQTGRPLKLKKLRNPKSFTLVASADRLETQDVGFHCTLGSSLAHLAARRLLHSAREEICPIAPSFVCNDFCNKETTNSKRDIRKHSPKQLSSQ